MYMDAGQKTLGTKNCVQCGMVYFMGQDDDDEKEEEGEAMELVERRDFLVATVMFMCGVKCAIKGNSDPPN